MKYKIPLLNSFLCLLVASATFAQTNTIQFLNTDFSSALKQAKAQNKLVFFMGYADWCPHCKNMEQKVFTNAAIAGFFNQQFICVAKDMEKGEGVQLKQTLGVRLYPTFIFLDSNGRTLYRVVGEYDTTNFLMHGRSAINPQKQLPYLKKQFEDNVGDAANCYAYLRALRMAVLSYKDVVRDYFSTQTDGQLLSDINWQIFALGATELSSRELNFVLHHQTEFAAFSSQERVEKKIAAMTNDVLSPLSERGDSVAYFRNRNYVSGSQIFKVDSLLFINDLRLYAKISDWNAYRKAALEFTDKYVGHSAPELKEIAGKYLQHAVDNDGLLSAEKWAQKALALREDYATCMLCANIYQKLNDKQNALAMARRAKDIAAKTGVTASEADSLLNTEPGINR